MKKMQIAAIPLICAAPLHTQAQQRDPAKLKADAQKFVSIISADEAKTQTYCEARDIAEQIVQAVQQKDNEKVEDLSNNLIEQQKNLGSEYLALMESLRSVILSPKDAQEIEALFDKLDGESCPQPGSRWTSIADEMREEHRRHVLDVESNFGARRHTRRSAPKIKSVAIASVTRAASFCTRAPS